MSERTLTSWAESRGINFKFWMEKVSGGWLFTVYKPVEYAGKTYFYQTTSTRNPGVSGVRRAANEISYQIISTRITIEEYESGTVVPPEEEVVPYEEAVAPPEEEVVPTAPPEEEILPYVPEALPTALPEEKKKKYLTCTLPLLSLLPPLPHFEGLPVPPGFEVIER